MTIKIANNITAQQHYKKKANRRTQQNTTTYSINPKLIPDSLENWFLNTILAHLQHFKNKNFTDEHPNNNT